MEKNLSTVQAQTNLFSIDVSSVEHVCVFFWLRVQFGELSDDISFFK